MESTKGESLPSPANLKSSMTSILDRRNNNDGVTSGDNIQQEQQKQQSDLIRKTQLSSFNMKISKKSSSNDDATHENKEHDDHDDESSVIMDEQTSINSAITAGQKSYLYNSINAPNTSSFNPYSMDKGDSDGNYNVTYYNEDDISTTSSSISISIMDYTSTLKEYIQPALDRSSHFIKTSLRWNHYDSSMSEDTYYQNDIYDHDYEGDDDDGDDDDDESISTTTTPRRQNYISNPTTHTQTGNHILHRHTTLKPLQSKKIISSFQNNHPDHYLTCTQQQQQNQNQKPLAVITIQYFLVALIIIVFLSSSWWWQLHINHNLQHGKSSVMTSSQQTTSTNTTPNPYYFWNLMYNDKNSTDFSYDPSGIHHGIDNTHSQNLDSVVSSESFFSWWFGDGSISFSWKNLGNGSDGSSSNSSSGLSSSSKSSSSTTSTDANDNEHIPSSYTPPTITSVKYKNPAQSSKLVIAGKMTVLDGFCNIAELSLNSGEWSLKERIQLSLYNSYSGGEVYSLLVNHTFNRDAFSFFNGGGGSEFVSSSGSVSGNDEKSSR